MQCKRVIRAALGLMSVLALVATLGVQSAEAIAIIKIDQAPFQDVQNGTLDWAGGSTPLVGENIGFSSIIGLDDLAGSGLVCNQAVSGFGNPCMLLSFTTGQYTGGLTWGDTPYMGNPVEFVVKLTDANALGLGLAADTEILTGTALFEASVTGNSTIGFTATLIGLDIKNQDIIDFFFPVDPPDNFRYVNTEIALDSTDVVITSGGFFTKVRDMDGNVIGTVRSPMDVSDADINNTPFDLPEPGTALLLLLGMGAIAARRRQRS